MRRDARSTTHPRKLPGPGDRPPGTGAGRGARRAGRAGLAATAVSIGLSLAVGLAGPSVRYPALPRGPVRAGQPPWAFGLHRPACLAGGLAARPPSITAAMPPRLRTCSQSPVVRGPRCYR